MTTSEPDTKSFEVAITVCDSGIDETDHIQVVKNKHTDFNIGLANFVYNTEDLMRKIIERAREIEGISPLHLYLRCMYDHVTESDFKLNYPISEPLTTYPMLVGSPSREMIPSELLSVDVSDSENKFEISRKMLDVLSDEYYEFFKNVSQAILDRVVSPTRGMGSPSSPVNFWFSISKATPGCWITHTSPLG